MNITVDFHQFSTEHAGADPATALLEWLKSSPNRSRIHVFLQPSRFDSAARQLQYALQSLGCTVTRRMPPVVAA